MSSATTLHQQVAEILTSLVGPWTKEAYAAVAITAVVVAWVFWSINEQPTKVRLVFNSSSKLNQFVSTSTYHPPWWAKSAHVQALLTVALPQAKIKFSRDLVGLQDGGHVAVDWCEGTSQLSTDAPILLVIHGLNGSSDEHRSFCADALQAGFRPVVFNKRGHGGSTVAAVPLLQAFGCVKDVTEAIDHIERKFPTAPMVGVGFSAGGGLVCSYLGETGKASKLKAGVLVSPSTFLSDVQSLYTCIAYHLDLALGHNTEDLFCGGGMNAGYDAVLTFALKRFLRQHKEHLSPVIDYPAAMKSRSVAEFDRHVYVKMHGYEDLASYWKHNDPLRAVENIAVPVLCINAKDDPVCTYGQIDLALFDKNPIGLMAITKYGSHCGFFEQTSWFQLKSWASKATLDYLTTTLRYLDSSSATSSLSE
ncbi:hypothetical protein B5M09_012110 [Aphanomyces astaci]|uniref:Serine aminopeptidase S33 domain-containing protein n=1 Tax=Aphanomyces astaci TaxID=112090 RepID=A0A3R7W8E6_APHAT|nr:hypothetical protein B5M09_012110 [Aphanomyces astaci]